MQQGINVLSLFDGMSCGQIALNRLGIKINKYYASEIDRYAIKITMKNYPDTIQLGDVEKISLTSLDNIDLLFAGSPCQGLSFAGKQLGFSDSRSRLFYKFVEIFKYLKLKNPDLIFLFENVLMSKSNIEIVNNLTGFEPVLIDSSLLSAQSRRRLYWTNIQVNDLPKDKGVKLIDILQDSFDRKYIHTPKGIEYMSRKVKGGRNHWDFGHHSDFRNAKSSAVVANFAKGTPYNVLIDSNCIRKFTPIECERLQTVPDNYTEGVSDTQRYKMLGNGWTIDVICHILSYAKF